MGIKLLHTDIEIIRIISEAAMRKIELALTNIESAFRKKTEELLRQSIENSEVWKSLGPDNERGLNAHFGIPVGENKQRRDNILNEWLKEIKIESQPPVRVGSLFKKQINIGAIYSDWSGVLSLQDGITTSPPTKARDKEDKIYWLEWLLTGEIREIEDLNNYQIKFDVSSKSKSRSGKAIMTKIRDGGEGYTFPRDLVGGEPTIDDNFVTRQLDILASQKNEFKKVLIGALNAM